MGRSWRSHHTGQVASHAVSRPADNDVVLRLAMVAFAFGMLFSTLI